MRGISAQLVMFLVCGMATTACDLAIGVPDNLSVSFVPNSELGQSADEAPPLDRPIEDAGDWVEPPMDELPDLASDDEFIAPELAAVESCDTVYEECLAEDTSTTPEEQSAQEEACFDLSEQCLSESWFGDPEAPLDPPMEPGDETPADAVEDTCHDAYIACTETTDEDCAEIMDTCYGAEEGAEAPPEDVDDAELPAVD